MPHIGAEPAQATLKVVDVADTPQTRQMVDRVHARWNASARPPFQHCDVTTLLEESFPAAVHAVWVLEGEFPANARVRAMVAMLVDHHVPVLVTGWRGHDTLGGVSREGAVTAPAAAGEQAISAVLRTVWAMQPSLMDLRSEVAFLRTHQGGLSEQIENLDEELRLAAQLQREFLHGQLPKIEHLEMDVLYRPAGYVSGDIYDVTRVDEDHVGLFIADASGHGVPAALMTMYIKRALQTKRIDTRLDGGYEIVPPDKAIERLNRDICRQQMDYIRPATACYGLLNIRTMRLSLSRAGHPYPLLFRKDGSMETIEPAGTMIGIIEDEVFETAHVQLAAGDRLAFFTDGFEVAFPKRGGLPRDTSRAYIDIFRQMRVAGSDGHGVPWLSHLLDRQVGSLNQCDDMTALFMAVDEVPGTRDAATTMDTTMTGAVV